MYWTQKTFKIQSWGLQCATYSISFVESFRCFRSVTTLSLSIPSPEKLRNTHYAWLEAQKKKKCFRKQCASRFLLIWAHNPFSPITFLEMFFSFFAWNNQHTALLRAAHGSGHSRAELHHTSTELADASVEPHDPSAWVWCIIKSFTCL